MSRLVEQRQEVPEVPLGNLVDIKVGLTPSRLRSGTKGKSNLTERISVRVLGPNYFDDEPSSHSNAVELDLTPKEYERFSLESGDLLFMSRGRSYWAKPKPAGNEALVFGSPFYRLRIVASDQLRAQYLWWYLNQSRTQASLLVFATGVTVPYISIKDLEKLKVPLPPLALQQLLGELQECIENHVDLGKQLLDAKHNLVDQLANQALDDLGATEVPLSHD